MSEARDIFEAAEAEAEKRIHRGLMEGATALSLAGLPIESLPPSLRQLAELVEIDLRSCAFLQGLGAFGDLIGLRAVTLSDCEQLRDLQPLAGLTGLQSLNLTRCYQLQDLKPLAGLTGLQSLDLSYCQQLQDLEPLAGLTGLQTLDLSVCQQVQDLGPLAGLTGLQTLDLSRCEQVQNLEPLAGLTSLQSVNLSGCEHVQDLEPLAGLTGLQTLDLSVCQQVQDLGPLAGLTGLQSLDLVGCDQVQDLQPLAGLTGLQSIGLSWCLQVQDLQRLAGLAGLQSLDLSGCDQVQDLQPLADLTGLQSLDLSICQQVQDLWPLAGLTGLQSLDLSGCDQVQDLQPFAGLTGLQSLDLTGCDKVQDLQPLAGLTGLQSVNLSECRQVKDLQPLAGLTGLQSVNLSECRQVKDLQPLAGLTGLQSVNLSGCDQVQDLKPLAGLTGLQSLNLSRCKQVQDLQPLAGLTGLQSLDLSGCSQAQDLRSLAGLTGLHFLDLSRCEQVQDLGPLAGLTGLQSLDLSGCSQVPDLRPLAGLTGLQSVNLSGCSQVQDLQPLAGLTGLQSLDLSWCTRLRDLEPLAALTKLRSFHVIGYFLNCAPAAKPMKSWPLLSELYADRLVVAPSELGSKSDSDNALPSIRVWQNDLLAGEASSSSLRVFILGNGRVGKTQICRRLLGQDFDSSIPSTHGIGLEDLQLAPARAEQPEVRAKLWDFGGQDIYLGTHGLFLDDRAVYVIAWAPQYEKAGATESGGVAMRNRPLTYWLEYVRWLAGPRAPIIVTQTQCDREADARIPPLPDDHGFDRLRTTYSSARQTDGLERLQLELKSAARYQLEQYGKVRLPLSWCSIAKELESRRHEKAISYEEFETLCRAAHGAAVPSVVLAFLHRRGQVFYRSGAFNNQVVLDLSWALDGIYAVLDRDRALPVICWQGGRFSPQLLAALVWKQYSPADHQLFLALMEQCQICFKAADDVYVAPALLPSESEARTSIDQTWRGAAPDAAAQLDYPFLHEGVLRGMLCGLGSKAGVNAVYWAYGICFYDSKSQATARIRSAFADPTGHRPGGRITVEAAGAQAGLLARNLVDSILRINIGAAPQVVWTKGESPERSEAAKVRDEKKASEPFQGVVPAQVPRPAGEPKLVYVSYAWKEESEEVVDDFAAKLPTTFKLMRDKDVMRTGDWISRFMLEIGRAEYVLVVISEEYLKSVYCMQELLHLYKSSLGEQAVLLDKLLPITVGTARFSRAKDRAKYVAYWETENRELDEVLARLDPLSIGDSDRAERLAIKDFAHRISDILSWLADVLMPKGLDVRTGGIDAAVELLLRRTQSKETAQGTGS